MDNTKECFERFQIINLDFQKEDIGNVLKEWYLRILNKESEYKYIVFTTERTYMLALVMEKITGVKMENKDKYITSGAFSSKCPELIMYYKKNERFPNILLCEDVLLHCCNFFRIQQNMMETFTKTLEFEEFQDILKTKDPSFKYGLIDKLSKGIVISSDARIRMNRFVVTKVKKFADSDSLKDNRVFLNNLTSQISSLVKFNNFTNGSSNCFEIINKENFCPIEEYDFIKTVYQNIVELTHIEPLCVENDVKAVFSIRLIQNDTMQDSFCVIPFVFLPNLGEEETNNLWDGIKSKILEKNDATSINFVSLMNELLKVNGKCTFNEYITLIFNYSILEEFNQRYHINFKKTDLYQKQLEILSGNYNVNGYEEAKMYLDNIFDKKYLSKEDLCRLLKTCINPKRKLCSIGYIEYFKDEDITQKFLENDWYQNSFKPKLLYNGIWLDRENNNREGFCFKTQHNLDNHCLKDIENYFANFLQMIDAGNIEFSSYPCSNMNVTGYSQFIESGPKAHLIYPIRFLKYLRLLNRAYSLCRSLNFSLVKVIEDFIKYIEKKNDEELPNVLKDIDISEYNELKQFVNIIVANDLDEIGCLDISVLENVSYIEKNGNFEIDMHNESFSSMVVSTFLLELFEKYVDDVVFCSGFTNDHKLCCDGDSTCKQKFIKR